MNRGDIYRVRPDKGRGHEQAGARFGVIVQSEFVHTTTVLVAMTSTRAHPSSYRPAIEVDGRQTRVLAEHLRGIDTDYLGEKVGHVSAEEMRSIDDALRVVLAL